MKRCVTVLLFAFLLLSHSAKAEWHGTAIFYAEPTTPHMAAMSAGQLLSFGNPIVFTHWEAGLDAARNPALQYKGIVQALSVEGMQLHVFFSRPNAKKAEGELNLEWMEKAPKKAPPWWKFWDW